MDRVEHVDVAMHISTIVQHIQAILCDAYRFAIGNDLGSNFIIHYLVILPNSLTNEMSTSQPSP